MSFAVLQEVWMVTSPLVWESELVSPRHEVDLLSTTPWSQKVGRCGLRAGHFFKLLIYYKH